MKRPFGITLLAVCLYWLGFGGLMLAVVAPTLAGLGVPWVWYRAAGLVYGVSAIITATGLWRQAAWTHKVFLGWAATALAAGSLPALTLPHSDTPWWVILLGITMIGAALWPVSRYIRRSVPTTETP